MSSKNLMIKHLLISTALLTTAFATPIKFTFSGAITSSNMGAFPLGQAVSVSLVYESSSSYQSLQSGQAFYVNTMSEVTFTSGGYSGTDDSGPFGWNAVYNNLPYNATTYDGIQFVAASDPSAYAFTTGGNTISMPSVLSNSVLQNFVALRVNLEAAPGLPLSDWSLPELVNLSDFNANRSMLFYFSHGSFMTGITSMQVEAVTSPGHSVPDAGSTVSLLFAGLGALMVAARRPRLSQTG